MKDKELEQIIDLYKKYNIQWFVNISISKSKSLDYSPLHDEISLDSSENLATKVVVIKDHKKSSFSIDWYSLEKIESSIKDILKVIDYSEYDEDIILPNITDTAMADFSNTELWNIWFEKLEEEFIKFKNFKFDENIIIESFSIWVHDEIHIYVNSLGSIKRQIDNWSYYVMEIFGQKDENRETHYEYINSKNLSEIKVEKILKLQSDLQAKLNSSTEKIQEWYYNITLENDVVINFLGVLLSNMWAESVREWISLFSKNNIWDKIFWDNFTLVNDPWLEWYTWNILFDWEWVTAQKRVLFDKWILKSFFYDYKNALKTDIKNLGNSSITNIEIIWNVDSNYLNNSKILFTNLMAFHTVDSSTWKYSLSWEWYLLDDWKKTKYIKDISLSWDIINLFSSITSLWDDFKTDWNFKVPSITFSNQKIV